MNANHTTQDEGFDPDEADERPPSRSMLKRASLELQVLGKQLLDMPAARLDDIPMPERLREALEAWKTTKSFEGKRRQLQYIGKVMRGVETEILREAVAEFQLGHARNALELHQAERWRVELLSDDKDVVTRWVAEFPDTDVQQLRALIRHARKDAAAEPEQRNGRAYRALFQYIKQAMFIQPKAGMDTDPNGDEVNDG